MSEEKKYATTPELFELYRSYASYWLSRFGLTEWNIRFKHEMHSEDGDVMAECYYDMDASSSTLYLNPNWKGVIPTPEEVCDSAYHEVCELLLVPIRHVGQDWELTPAQKRSAMARSGHIVLHRIAHAYYAENDCIRDEFVNKFNEAKT